MLDAKEALSAPAPTDPNGREKESGSFEEFLRYGTIPERPKRPATLRTYLYAVRRFERYLGERAPTPDLAKGFIADLEGTTSPSSLNVYIAALISYFHFLGQELVIPRFGTHKDNPPILSGGEWQWLLTTATEPIHDPGGSGYGRFRALSEMCVLCVYCDSGLQPSEAICLKADDVSNEGYLKVTHSDGNIERVPISGTALKHIKDTCTIGATKNHTSFQVRGRART